jgi:HK97 family phage portal protein
MGLLDRVRGLLTRGIPAGVTVADGMAVTSASGVRGPARRGTRELIAGYREQPWLRAVTSRIARGVASVGWEVYARSASTFPEAVPMRSRQGPSGAYQDVTRAPAWRWGQERGVRDYQLASLDYSQRAARRRSLAESGHLREVPDHPALGVLANPNPFMTGRAALQLTQTWLDIKGEGFWLLSFGPDGMPNGFLPVPPHWVQSCPTDAQPYFRVSFSGLQVQLKPEAVIWFKDADPENPYGRGTGVAESLGDELETDEFAAKYLKAWFYNSGIPSMVLSFEGVQPDQLARAKEKYESEHRGYQNAHRTFFASGKMNAVRLDSSFRDQQIIDLRKLSRDTIAQVFAVPPELLGIIENSNRSTISAARFIYVLGVEWPRAEFLRTELQVQFLSRWDAALVLEVEVPLPDDEDRRLKVMQAQPTCFSMNEWRAEAGKSPLPEFDGKFPAGMPGQLPAEPDPEEETPAEDPELEAPEEEDAPPPPPATGEGRADPPWALRKVHG